MDPGALFPGGPLYIDPGSGSFALQVLVGGFLGALVAVKVYWRKLVDGLKAFFSAKAGS